MFLHNPATNAVAICPAGADKPHAAPLRRGAGGKNAGAVVGAASFFNSIHFDLSGGPAAFDQLQQIGDALVFNLNDVKRSESTPRRRRIAAAV